MAPSNVVRQSICFNIEWRRILVWYNAGSANGLQSVFDQVMTADTGIFQHCSSDVIWLVFVFLCFILFFF